MVQPATPYTKDLDNREPIASMREFLTRVRSLTKDWSADRFERTYAPGKWTARQIVTHLAQTELALGTRARMALTIANYEAQSFDQNRWIERDTLMSGQEAVDALVAIGRMNAALFESLTAADRQTTLSHPEYGALTVDWIIHQMAGHQIHHLRQLEQIV